MILVVMGKCVLRGVCVYGVDFTALGMSEACLLQMEFAIRVLMLYCGDDDVCVCWRVKQN